MRKCLVPLLAAAILGGSVATSQAVTFTYNLALAGTYPGTPPPATAISTPAANWDTATGVVSDAGAFTTQIGSGLGFTNPRNYALSYPAFSNVTYGVTSTTRLGAGNATDHWNTNKSASFQFSWTDQNTGVTKDFLATGSIGSISSPVGSNTITYVAGPPPSGSSTAYWWVQNLYDITDPTNPLALTTSVISHAAFQYLGTEVYFGGNDYLQFFLRLDQQIPIASQTNLVDGLARVRAVPEPGAVAMLFGFGASAGLALLRRRRAA